MARKKLASCCFKLLLLTSLIAWSTVLSLDSSPGKQSEELSIGGIVDLTTHIGKEERAAMQVAIEDLFSGVDLNSPTLLVKDSRGEPTRAVSSAKNLIKKSHVAAIVGLRTWPETFFVAEVGNKSKVPIISLSNEVPSWSDSNRPFLVNAARSQFAQMKAVADIISSWKWRKVNVIYEDINSAVSGIIPYLISALQVCLPSDSSDDHHRLRVSSFLGLFGISVGISTFALVLFYIFYRREQIARDREEAAGPGPGPPAHEPPAVHEPPAGGPEPPARGPEPAAHEPPARGPEPPARGTEPPAHEPPAIELVARGSAAHEQPEREPEPPEQGPAADDNIHWNRKRSSSRSTRTSSISHRKGSHSY